jgi:hypothetical protein
MDSAPDVVRVTANLPGPAVQQLKTNAAMKGDNLTQGLKAAISTKLFLDDAVQSGGKVLVKQSDGTLVEVVLP